MNERSAGIFLLLLLIINQATAQIQFPNDENYDRLVADLTAIRVDRAPPPYNQPNQHISSIQNPYPYSQQFYPNFPIPQNNYPSQQDFRIQQNYPIPQNLQTYPSQQRNQNNSPSQQSNQKRPTQQPNHPSSSSTQKNNQRSIRRPSQQNSAPQSRKVSSPQQGRQKRPQQARRSSSSPPQRNQQNVPKVVAQGFTKLILDINRVTPSTSSELSEADNVVYGPVTIAGALSMVLLASIGKTFDEIANLLGLSSTSLGDQNDPIYVQEQIARLFSRMETTTGLEIGQRVNFATAIFVQHDYPVRPVYQKAAELLYHSDIMNLDFRSNPQNAMDVINTWVSGRTNGKIPSLFTEPPPTDTKTIIASALYFQAAWEFPFFDGGTHWRPFFINGRKNPSDRMALMMSNGGEFPYHKDSKLGVEILGFPYKGKATTMYVIMPMESNKEKLKKLENSLTPADIDHLVNSTKYIEAVVLFPKMKLESSINLKPALQMLGVTTMFNQREANMALLSEGISQRYNGGEAPFVSGTVGTTPRAPAGFRRPTRLPVQDNEDRLIFARFGDSSNNCIPIFDPITNASRCDETLPQNASPVPLATRAESNSIPVLESLSNIRQQMSQNPDASNPGLYADQVIHKVYIDITESGTEAAAATGISSNRSGDRVTFRVDIPFLFFIYHEETKVILFWGSVKSPSPTALDPKTN